jgi:threonine dehydrogenase-like Zn-dependent dehydrogenase
MQSFSSNSGSLFTKVAVMGGGNMAEAIIAAVKTSKKQDMSKVMVVDINKSRLKYLQGKYGVSITQDANEAAKDAEMLVGVSFGCVTNRFSHLLTSCSNLLLIIP